MGVTVNSTKSSKSSDALKKKLARLGVYRQEDLLLHFPLRYEDETRVVAISDLRIGNAYQIQARVLSAEVQTRPRRQLVVHVADASGELILRFFSFYPPLQAMLAEGSEVRVFGEFRQGFHGGEMVHPRCQLVSACSSLPTGLTPVYPTTAGLTSGGVRKLIAKAMLAHSLADSLPPEIRAGHGLMLFQEAVKLLHEPTPEVPLHALEQRTHPAWQRIKFDEILAQQLSLRKAYTARRQQGAPALLASGRLAQAFSAGLPFGLTRAQGRAASEISKDLSVSWPMQRLLQGDVGAGKTVVAALAACHAIEAGWQVALMAPTEILAEQHYVKLKAWFGALGIEVAWLSGSLKTAEKRAQLAKAVGTARLVVGTHALIQEGVDFSRLGLVIIDEQHRFGVAQRLALRNKGHNPHQLMMSATPIPRTLAMSYYADLDVSVLDELPPGRTPVKTRLVSDGRRDDVIHFVAKQVAQGQQVYWVCPLIEESEALQLQTAEEAYQQLSEALPDLQIGLVHGRLKPLEKQNVMTAFVAGEIQVLVATTVIEVGVDVPNASLMVIEHAERFGLSQLHQLRGRVGRGATESSCVLLYANPLSQTARQRLKIIYENTDGFEIARHDLALRGPGEFVGSRQSGVPLLRYADLTEDEELVERARVVAETLLAHFPHHAERHLSRWLGQREELLKS